ncbi:MAG: SAM-dependent chlorinase/fluorinase [Methanocella sp.]
MSGIITITTDFGDVYPGIMKGVIACIDGDLRTIDITNAIPQGDIRRGAFILRYASGYFPAGSVHLAVVDPGVGSDRRALVIKGERCSFVGPDNGLLMPAVRAQGPFRAYEITKLDFYTKKVSPVFHGRDIFAPAAALIASGRPVPGWREIDDPVDLDFGAPRLEEDRIAGRVIFVDSFGNIVTNIGGDALKGLCHLGEVLEVNEWPARMVSTYYEGEEGELMVLEGSHGMIELAYKGGSAGAMTGLTGDDTVSIRIVRPEKF